uniref:Transposase n=1 Tax=Loa loa TaxID=7209 RepID=A0A1I7VXG7_LOALO
MFEVERIREEAVEGRKSCLRVRGAVVSSAGAPFSILPQICPDMKRGRVRERKEGMENICARSREQQGKSVVVDSGWSAYVNSSGARQKKLSIGECAFALPAESVSLPLSSHL